MLLIGLILAAGVVLAIRAITGGGEGGATVGALPANPGPAITSPGHAAAR